MIRTGTDDGSDQALIELIDRRCTVAHTATLPARPGVVGTPARPVSTDLLRRLGVDHLWSHQAAALDRIRDGESVVLTSGTGSGKSLAYQIPVVEAVVEGPSPHTSLLLFPTKALAHDQLTTLATLGIDEVTATTYDGDSSREHRAWARRRANVLLTNPEMLHSGILANHRRWSPFLARLRYVVVDELHLLRGVFGTNVAHLLRRLRRIAAHHGAEPQFVFCSASLGQPAQLASDLSGLDVGAITTDGAPRGRRTFVLCDPLQDRQTTATWRAAASVTAALVDAGQQSLAFARSRKLVELMAAAIRSQVDDPRGVCSYRSGYLADERREIETALGEGHLRAVTATSALELGIDVGGLDATILAGFPGTISSLWQQAGRSGRQGRSGISVLVAGDDQLDRWYVRHPDQLLDRSPEPAVINPGNQQILLPHLRCAAQELPLEYRDEALWPTLDDGVRSLTREDSVWIRRRSESPLAVWSTGRHPQHRVGLRSAGGGQIRITDQGVLIGTVDAGRAARDVHPGAVYLHRGHSYRVIDLDLAGREAQVVLEAGDRSTQPRSETTLRVLEVDARRPVGPIRVGIGTVEVERRVVGYTERDARTGEPLDHHALELPAHHLVTRGVWLECSPAITADVEDGTLPGALHALEHAAIGLLPLFTICDRWDVGGVSTAHLADLGCAAVVIYDAYAGGVGIAELAYQEAEALLAATVGVIGACDCEDGCPSCVQSPKCGNGNDPLDKDGALVLLDRILAAGHRRSAS